MRPFLALLFFALVSCHGVSLTTGVGKSWGDGSGYGSGFATSRPKDNLSSSFDSSDGDAVSAWIAITAQLTPSSVTLVQSTDDRGFTFPSYEPMEFVSPAMLDAIERMDDPAPMPIDDRIEELVHVIAELRSELALLRENAITWKGMAGVATGGGGGAAGLLLLAQRLRRRRNGGGGSNGSGGAPITNEELAA